MKYFSIPLLVILSVFFFFSCEKETETIILPSNLITIPNSSQINKFFEDNLEDATETINANSSIYSQTIVSNKGISYTFGANTFINSTGNPVSGNFSIELVEALTKKEMIISLIRKRKMQKN